MNTFNPSENKTFDVNTYETEDLLGILNLTGQAPINKEKIDERVQELKYTLRNNKKKAQVFKFLELASDKLKKNFEMFNEETWQEAYEHDDSEASKVLMQQYQTKEKNDTKNQILNWSSNIIGRPAQSQQDKIAIQDTVQGDKNPIQRKTIKRTVNFDSHYREILDPSGTTCTNDKFADANPQVRLYTSTNYTVNLNQPLLNVVDINVDNIEIPYSWHVFAEDYGTNRFVIKVTDHNYGNAWTRDIIIPSGNYSSSQSLVNEINKALQTIMLNNPTGNSPNPLGKPVAQWITGEPGIYFQADPFSNKTIIYVNQNTIFEWYIADEESVGCAAPFRETENSLLVPPKPGNKINYNLGWLLGFRNLDLEISHDKKYNYRIYTNGAFEAQLGVYMSPSTIDIYGPKYFLLTLDDFNNNKPNKDLISLIDNNSNNFKLPEYFKPQTMNTAISVPGLQQGNENKLYQPGHPDDPAYECVDVAGPPSSRGCAENDINVDLISNLTKKQQYSVAQMISANTTSNRKPRYSSPNSTDILLRIPVNSPTGNSNQIISLQNDKPEETKRIYFGPVKLRKFNVRLLNDKGFEVNLNDRDWSFSLIVNQLYQF
ncbi:MAG: hypothetical protein L7S72_05735 [Flavobacteriales bacterium]|nr:hypothetical protein [Flavobacteriales bacterium]